MSVSSSIEPVPVSSSSWRVSVSSPCPCRARAGACPSELERVSGRARSSACPSELERVPVSELERVSERARWSACSFVLVLATFGRRSSRLNGFAYYFYNFISCRLKVDPPTIFLLWNRTTSNVIGIRCSTYMKLRIEVEIQSIMHSKVF